MLVGFETSIGVIHFDAHDSDAEGKEMVDVVTDTYMITAAGLETPIVSLQGWR